MYRTMADRAAPRQAATTWPDALGGRPNDGQLSADLKDWPASSPRVQRLGKERTQ
jgi:hypothetical protein